MKANIDSYMSSVFIFAPLCPQTIEDEEIFEQPLVASSLRILINEPANIPELFGFTVDIFGCYEDYLTGNSCLRKLTKSHPHGMVS